MNKSTMKMLHGTVTVAMSGRSGTTCVVRLIDGRTVPFRSTCFQSDRPTRFPEVGDLVEVLFNPREDGDDGEINPIRVRTRRQTYFCDYEDCEETVAEEGDYCTEHRPPGSLGEEFEKAAQAIERWPEWKKEMLRRAREAEAFFEGDPTSHSRPDVIGERTHKEEGYEVGIGGGIDRGGSIVRDLQRLAADDELYGFSPQVVDVMREAATMLERYGYPGRWTGAWAKELVDALRPYDDKIFRVSPLGEIAALKRDREDLERIRDTLFEIDTDNVEHLTGSEARELICEILDILEYEAAPDAVPAVPAIDPMLVSLPEEEARKLAATPSELDAAIERGAHDREIAEDVARGVSHEPPITSSAQRIRGTGALPPPGKEWEVGLSVEKHLQVEAAIAAAVERARSEDVAQGDAYMEGALEAQASFEKGKDMLRKRMDAYRALDSERAYQDARWNESTTSTAGKHSVVEWLVFIQSYLHEAQDIVAREREPEASAKALHIIRKIGGMAVACMEQHGAPIRTAPEP